MQVVLGCQTVDCRATLQCCVVAVSATRHASVPDPLLPNAGGIHLLVMLVKQGSESASAGGAAHALAALTTGRNASTYRAAVQQAGGVPALLM